MKINFTTVLFKTLAIVAMQTRSQKKRKRSNFDNIRFLLREKFLNVYSWDTISGSQFCSTLYFVPGENRPYDCASFFAQLMSLKRNVGGTRK